MKDLLLTNASTMHKNAKQIGIGCDQIFRNTSKKKYAVKKDLSVSNYEYDFNQKEREMGIRVEYLLFAPNNKG